MYSKMFVPILHKFTSMCQSVGGQSMNNCIELRSGRDSSKW